MKINTKPKSTEFTHEGAPAKIIPPLAQLRRSIMACMLWEDSFYEGGQEIAKRIESLCCLVKPEQVAELAIEARKLGNLRHAPLWLLKALCKVGSGSSLVSNTIAEVISRADELAEFVAMYWKDGKKPLSAQAKKGLAKAFQKFDAYQLAKYNRDGAVKLRDVLFMVHAKPKDEEQKAVWKKLAEGTLESPDTWEVALSAGKDKKETFERLIKEENLGYLAMLRNLRNMEEAKVEPALVRSALVARKGAKNVLPFRFIAAAKAAPRFEPELDKAFIASIEELPELSGETIVLVDVSGSMDATLSSKSDMNRMDAACALACIIRGNKQVFSFSMSIVEVAPRISLSGVNNIKTSQAHGGTDLGGAVAYANSLPHDRLIVITDEQSESAVPDPVAKKAYMINVASEKNGVGYGRWTHLDGFSENIIKFIHEYERA